MAKHDFIIFDETTNMTEEQWKWAAQYRGAVDSLNRLTDKDIDRITYPPEMLPGPKPEDDGAEIIVVYQGDSGVWLHLYPTMGEPYMDGPSDCFMMIPREGNG